MDVIREAATLGFAGIYVREEAGGSGLTRLDAALIFEQLSLWRRIHGGVPVDPQHGLLDDRHVRIGRAARHWLPRLDIDGADRHPIA